MRVFAGPNGSGKSTIIKAVRQYRNNPPLDFGIYINAGVRQIQQFT
jgi:ABC-type cobalamin/Fe3+-siderophores transport system ATPase subunit